jgi:hypothetical protein
MNLAPRRVAEPAIRASEPGRVSASGSRSFPTYLFFINTKTRQPVGFQSTDIVD